MGASQGADIEHKMISQTAPAGRPVGPPRGGFCYLDNIEITEAKREILLLCPSFYAFSNIAKKVLTSMYLLSACYE